MALSEFDLIRHYFSSPALNFKKGPVVLGPGDDAAILEIPSGSQLVMSMDTLNESVHFPEAADPFLLGQRCLLVNLSDMAAMGAEPLAFTLAISLPQSNASWLEAFSRGLAEVATTYQCPLIGGDTTRGPLSITVQIHGLVPQGQALLRSGARAGDAVYVTGELGDGGAALWWLMHDQRLLSSNLNSEDKDHLRSAFYTPQAQIKAGIALRGLASAALDISDGLIADLQHILNASGGNTGLSAEIETQAVPMSETFKKCIPAHEQLRMALSAGDDYELCVCIPADNEAEAIARMNAMNVRFTRIGQVVVHTQEQSDRSIVLRYPDGRKQRPQWSGYNHFVDDGALAEGSH